MQVARVRSLQRGLDNIFRDAGQSLTWYAYSGTGSHLPEFGLGVLTTYYTSYIKGIIDRARQNEIPQVGGVTQQGFMVAMIREAIGPSDMLEFGITRYRVEGQPTPEFLGATHFYRLVLRRAE